MQKYFLKSTHPTLVLCNIKPKARTHPDPSPCPLSPTSKTNQVPPAPDPPWRKISCIGRNQTQKPNTPVNVQMENKWKNHIMSSIKQGFRWCGQCSM